MSGVDQMKESQFELSPETAEMSRRIIGVLAGVNNEISDETLNQIIGMEIWPNNYALQAALRQMERAVPPVCFRRRRGKGWKRETDTDLVEGSEGALKKLARGARRGSKRLSKVVAPLALSNETQLQYTTNLTRLYAMEDAASSRKPRRPKESLPELQCVLDAIKRNATA
jgi:hypothetical protein